MASCTSPTCTTASSRNRSGRSRSRICAGRSSSTNSTRSSTRAGSGGCVTTACRRFLRFPVDRAAARQAIRRCRKSQPDFAPPRMFSETPAQLVAHLTHPNGWWRDTAQRLLVLAQDRSVVPALETMARTSDGLVARFHAMWTLEGLGVLDGALVREQMRDVNPRVRVQAIRASETLYKAGDKSFSADYRAMTTDADPDVAIQALLTLNLFQAPDVAETIKTTLETNKARGVAAIGNRLLAAPGQLPGTAAAAGRGQGAGLTPDERELMQRGGAIYHRAVLHVPRRRRPRRAAGRRRAGRHHRAAARRIASRARPSGLRGESAPERPGRPGWEQELSGSHDPDGREHGRMDRRRGVVRAQQLRQRIGIRDPVRRQTCARGNAIPQDTVDRRGARTGAPADHGHESVDMEGDGEP